MPLIDSARRRRGVVLASAAALAERPQLARDIYSRRVSLGYTQAELAALVKCTQSDISEFEHGKLIPGPTRLRRLKKALRWR